MEPPVELEGDYELHSVDGTRPPVPLPEMFDPGPLRCEASERELTRGHLTLQLGHYHMTLHVRETCEASSDPEIRGRVVQGRYESDGTAVVLLRLKHGGDPRDGEPILEGALKADTLTLEAVEEDRDFSFARMADQE